MADLCAVVQRGVDSVRAARVSQCLVLASRAGIVKARHIVAAFRAAEARGSAALALEGALVDYAIVVRAERGLDAAARIDARRSPAS